MELNRNKIEISENTKAIALKAIGHGGTRDNWLILISHVKMSRQDDEEIFTVYRHISFNLSNHETFMSLANNGKWGSTVGYDFYIPTQEERMFIKNELKKRGLKFIPILNKLIKK